MAEHSVVCPSCTCGCTCGYGGFHEPENNSCDLNQQRDPVHAAQPPPLDTEQLRLRVRAAAQGESRADG